MLTTLNYIFIFKRSKLIFCSYVYKTTSSQQEHTVSTQQTHNIMTTTYEQIENFTFDLNGMDCYAPHIIAGIINSFSYESKMYNIATMSSIIDDIGYSMNLMPTILNEVYRGCLLSKRDYESSTHWVLALEYPEIYDGVFHDMILNESLTHDYLIELFVQKIETRSNHIINMVKEFQKLMDTNIKAAIALVISLYVVENDEDYIPEEDELFSEESESESEEESSGEESESESEEESSGEKSESECESENEEDTFGNDDTTMYQKFCKFFSPNPVPEDSHQDSETVYRDYEELTQCDNCGSAQDDIGICNC